MPGPGGETVFDGFDDITSGDGSGSGISMMDTTTTSCGVSHCTLSADEITEKILGGEQKIIAYTEVKDLKAECAKACIEQNKLIDENCRILRLRVQEFLKNKGCPSSVRAYKKSTKGKACGYSRTYSRPRGRGGCVGNVCSL